MGKIEYKVSVIAVIKGDSTPPGYSTLSDLLKSQDLKKTHDKAKAQIIAMSENMELNTNDDVDYYYKISHDQQYTIVGDYSFRIKSEIDPDDTFRLRHTVRP